MSPVKIESSGPVGVILGTAEEPRLRRDRNYTLRVTVVTEYANISSTTDFSERLLSLYTADHILTTLCVSYLVYRYRCNTQFSRFISHSCTVQVISVLKLQGH